MNKNLNFKRRKSPKMSINSWKGRTLIVSGLFIAALVAVSFSSSSLASSSTQTALSSESKPNFNLEIAYSYVGQGTNNSCADAKGNLLTPASLYPSAVYFNVTRSLNSSNVSCDAIIEVYMVKVASDKGPVENFVYFDGTNFEPSFSEDELHTLSARIYDLIDLRAIDGISGNFCFNWTLGESVMSQKVGSIGVYDNYSNGKGLWSAGQPNVISVTVQRLGYVTMKDRIISVNSDSALTNITQAQLHSYGSGFLSNNAVPEDQLSSIDLFHPFK